MTTARGRHAGIALLAVTKATDAGITVVGLRELPVAERNAVARQVFDTVGPTAGVLLLTVVSVAVAVAGVEAGATLLPAEADLSPVAVRLFGYGSLGAVWAAVSIHNAVILAGTVAVG